MIDRARLESIVREAGRMALDTWPGDGHALEVWEKSPNNPVCAADIAVDNFLKRELGALLPSAGWLSEETTDAPERLGHDGLGAGLAWLVDPIDGTRDFIHGRPGWAVSVALVSSGRPLFGMLHAPARGEFWHAEAGRGAWRNGEPLVASSRTTLPGARVPVDHLPPVDADLTKVYKPLLQELGLTYPQYLAMMVLWEGDGITVGDISSRLLTDPGSVTPLLKRLEAEGLLKRTRSSVDERVVELFLTDKGRNLREQAKRIPGCILTATQQSAAELGALKAELVALRSSLQQAV